MNQFAWQTSPENISEEQVRKQFVPMLSWLVQGTLAHARHVQQRRPGLLSSCWNSSQRAGSESLASEKSGISILAGKLRMALPRSMWMSSSMTGSFAQATAPTSV